MRRIGLAFAFVVLAAAHPAAAAPSVTDLIDAYARADDECRGSPGDTGASACDRRSRIGSRLDQIDWCYGVQGQGRPGARWHKCTSASVRSYPLNPVR